jgi:histidinol dehydrogenase
VRRLVATDPAVTVAELRFAAPPRGDVRRAVEDIVGKVRRQGDAALRDLTERLDGVTLPPRLAVPRETMQQALRELDPELRSALELAAANIRAYHEHEAPVSWRETLSQGQVVGQEIVPLAAAGLYVPGGLANYPSTVLMTAIPALVAGVGRLVVCSPPRPGGGVGGGVAAACALLGIGDLYPVGGAQAVAAMAFGTAQVPRCDIVAGPGNAFVTEAKRQLMGDVAIDSLAGPSEVIIVAGEGARPDWLASDLLAQAEHGAGATGVLLDIGGTSLDQVEREVHRLADELRVSDEAVALVGCASLEEALALVDAFAPEHLELHLEGAAELVPRVRNAGAIFVGPLTATAFADYAAGTNHVLPTGGTATFAQGLSVAHFQKRVGVLEMDAAAVGHLAAAVAAIAQEEGLPAHRASALLRLGENRPRGDGFAGDDAGEGGSGGGKRPRGNAGRRQVKGRG